jgi:hypothetical protein
VCKIKKQSKAIPVLGGGSPYICEISKIPYFVDSLLRDGGVVISLTRRRRFIPQEDSLYFLLLEAESTPDS